MVGEAQEKKTLFGQNWTVWDVVSTEQPDFPEATFPRKVTSIGHRDLAI